MQVALQIAQIVMAVTITILVLAQSKGGGVGSMFGGEGVYRTRRGIEKSIHQATIALAVLFCLFSIIMVMLTAQ